MNTKILKTLISLFFVLVWVSCEDPNDDQSNNQNNNDDTQESSTIGQDLSGSQDPIASIFFDLSDESLDYTYDFYSVSGIGYANTINLPCSIRETDIVNFYTFPEYLIEAQNCLYENCGWCSGQNLDSDLSPEECDQAGGTWVESTDELDNIDNYISNSLLDETYGGLCSCWCVDNDGDMVDCASQNAVSQVYTQGVPTQEGGQCQNSDINNESECTNSGWVWFTDSIDCSLMDANQDCVMQEAQDLNIINSESAEFSISYTNLEKLVWDVEAGRYKPQVSSEITEEVSLTDETDVYDVSRYWTIINEWENLDGKVYVDHSQWNDTTIVYEEQEVDCLFLGESECNDAGLMKGCIWNGSSCEVQDCSSIDNAGDCIGNCLWINEVCSDSVYPVPVDVIIDQTFDYTSTILNPDSLMFRINSDCNNDGTWTAAETYEDIGTDGCPDEYEDGNGGCVCDYPDGCSDDDIQTGSDPNIDNWQQGLSIDVYTENNGQYDCVSPYCNKELSLDAYRGEPFDDRPDNLPSAEVYWDIPIGDTEVGNGQWQGQELEPWADLNCNLLYDDVTDGSGNGLWDADEIFQDLDGNGVWNDNEPLYNLSDTPNQIIVNYDTDGSGTVDELDGPAQVITEIDPDEINSAMVYLNGNYVSYSDIIKEQSFQEYKYYSYTPIKEVVTVFSNEIIEDIPAPLISDEYSIAKTYWPTLPDGTDVDGNGIADRYYDYDYHLFKYDDGANRNLLKLIHPSYYYNPGFFESPDQIEDGFFEISDLVEDIMIYVSGDNLRDGEKVVTFSVDSVDVNGDGTHNHIYDITKEFEVEFVAVDVPMRKYLGSLTDDTNNQCDEGQVIECADGTISCPDMSNSSGQVAENECGEYIKDIDQCSADTTINAYKVVRTKNSVMHGSGVEYGERNTIWMAEGIGIVKDKLEIRWSGENGATDNWTEYSRLELRNIKTVDSGFNLGRMFNSGKVIDINNFENQEGFNNDPYIPHPTAILQRVRVNND